MDKKDSLFSLAEGIRKCVACPLWKGRTLAVPGDGDAKAKIMLVGEAPGAEEDRQGSPFVGRAGKFLDKMLAIADLDREKVFITNVIKCRPPENRDPKKEEVTACKKWLEKQIAVIDPKLIVVLGRIALKRLLDKDKIGELRGKTVEKKYFSDGKFVSRKYFITYHPSAGLRSPEKFGGAIKKDFLKLKKMKL
ncbi:uracil-DNA glycosylase [Candidatus Woesearchaeota archaeon]|nr:uracil-DNA glycosylase [Candidatus Woesearchaeota archaeon]